MSKKIIIACDNEHICDFIENYAEKEGFTVKTICDISEDTQHVSAGMQPVGDIRLFIHLIGGIVGVLGQGYVLPVDKSSELGVGADIQPHRPLSRPGK